MSEIAHIASWADSPTITVVLVVVFALMVVAQNFMGTLQLEKVRQFFRNKERAAYANSDADNTLTATLLLLVCAIATYSLFLSLIYCRIEGQTYVGARTLWLPLIMVGLMLLWLFVQLALFRFAGYCANRAADMRQLTRTFLATFIAIGLVLFPIVVGLIYAPPALFDALMYVGFGIVAIGLIFLIITCLQLFFSGIDTVCYLFLYLCTLEILPILLLRNAVRMLVANVLT